MPLIKTKDVLRTLPFISEENRVAAFDLFLTGSRAHSVHGSHGLPLIPLRVVALTGAEPIGPVEPPHSVKQPVDHCNTHTDSPCQHGGNQLPLVPFWIIPSMKKTKQNKMICFIWYYFQILGFTSPISPNMESHIFNALLNCHFQPSEG